VRVFNRCSGLGVLGSIAVYFIDTGSSSGEGLFDLLEGLGGVFTEIVGVLFLGVFSEELLVCFLFFEILRLLNSSSSTLLTTFFSISTGWEIIVRL